MADIDQVVNGEMTPVNFVRALKSDAERDCIVSLVRVVAGHRAGVAAREVDNQLQEAEKALKKLAKAELVARGRLADAEERRIAAIGAYDLGVARERRARIDGQPDKAPDVRQLADDKRETDAAVKALRSELTLASNRVLTKERELRRLQSLAVQLTTIKGAPVDVLAVLGRALETT